MSFAQVLNTCGIISFVLSESYDAAMVTEFENNEKENKKTPKLKYKPVSVTVKVIHCAVKY